MTGLGYETRTTASGGNSSRGERGGPGTRALIGRGHRLPEPAAATNNAVAPVKTKSEIIKELYIDYNDYHDAFSMNLASTLCSLIMAHAAWQYTSRRSTLIDFGEINNQSWGGAAGENVKVKETNEMNFDKLALILCP